MTKCITPEDFQRYSSPNDFMVLFGGDNQVYHIKDWNHPGGWDYTLGTFAGQLQDAEPAFKRNSHSSNAKNFLLSKHYGFLS